MKKLNEKKKVLNEKGSSNKSLIQPVPDDQIIDDQYYPVLPYGTVGRNTTRFASLPPNLAKFGSDVLHTPFITLTAAHLLDLNGEGASSSFSQIGIIPNGNNSGYIVPNGSFDAVDYRISDAYRYNSNQSDYGVLRVDLPFFYPFYTDINFAQVYPRTLTVLG